MNVLKGLHLSSVCLEFLIFLICFPLQQVTAQCVIISALLFVVYYIVSSFDKSYIVSSVPVVFLVYTLYRIPFLTCLIFFNLYTFFIYVTYPNGAFLDRLVLFLLANLGSHLNSQQLHCHCLMIASSIMFISVTECFFNRFVHLINNNASFDFLSKVRLTMITTMVAVLLKISIGNTNEKLQPKHYILSHSLTSQEILGLTIILLAAIHLALQECFRTTQTIVKRVSMSEPVKVQEVLESSTHRELLEDVLANRTALRSAEKGLKNYEKALLRREFLNAKLGKRFCNNDIPFKDIIDFETVEGICCDNLIGAIPIPLGFVGPLNVNNKDYFVPMATTEGALIASTARGCKALYLSPGGVCSHVTNDSMSRGPVLKVESIKAAMELKRWLESSNGFTKVKNSFESTSRFLRLTSIRVSFGTGQYVYLRFQASTGDAMGMNMMSKGTEFALQTIIKQFPQVQLISLSGNFCCDKKPASINWLEGRGKSVIAEARIPFDVIKKILHTDPEKLVNLNLAKNFVGSAMAGAQPGAGCNAHAANVVAAIFIACGQDVAQVVSSSSCLTWMELDKEKKCLYMSCNMPSLEVGTVGGGTFLKPQASCLEMMETRGSSVNSPGENAKTLATIIAATVMASELSLLSALSTNDLVNAHMKLNRSKS